MSKSFSGREYVQAMTSQEPKYDNQVPKRKKKRKMAHARKTLRCTSD